MNTNSSYLYEKNKFPRLDYLSAASSATKKDLRDAKNSFIYEFGKEVFEKEIAPFLDNGVMPMFKITPTPYTHWYIENLAHYVNMRLIARQLISNPPDKEE